MRQLGESEVLVVGLGQIGGSVGLCLKQRHRVRRVTGYDRRRTVAATARRIGAVDSVLSSLKRAISSADIIILATPIREVSKLLALVAKTMRADALCIDVASTKDGIVRTAEKFKDFNFVGGHPLAGSEQEGLSGASSDKFAGKAFVLIPMRDGSTVNTKRATALVKALGSKPLIMNAEEHDRILALTSGLPHAVALALTTLTDKTASSRGEVDPLAGGSLLSATRVAQSPEHLVSELLMTNRTAVRQRLTEMIEELRIIKRLLAADAEEDLSRYVHAAHQIATGLHKRTSSSKRGTQ